MGDRFSGIWRSLLALAVVGGTLQGEDTVEVKEYKAALLLKVTRFVEWPGEAFADKQAPILVGILGQDPFGAILDRTFKGETAKGRPFEIRRHDAPERLQPCHLLFICASENDRLAEIKKRLAEPAFAEKGPLTVGDMPDFAERGGIVHFAIEQKLRIRINVDAAARAKIKISSQLLKLAAIVKDDGKPRE